jgi:hypothetical protein
MQTKRAPIIIETPYPTLEEVNLILDHLMGEDEPTARTMRNPSAPKLVAGNGHRRPAPKTEQKVSRKGR